MWLLYIFERERSYRYWYQVTFLPQTSTGFSFLGEYTWTLWLQNIEMHNFVKKPGLEHENFPHYVHLFYLTLFVPVVSLRIIVMIKEGAA